MKNEIMLSNYLYFDSENGRFYLTSEAQEIIYRKKGIICSYSGSNEWADHFACELIDLYSGSSKFNYSLGQIVHEIEIPIIWGKNKQSVIDWINKSKNENWGKACFKMFDMTIDTLP